MESDLFVTCFKILPYLLLREFCEYSGWIGTVLVMYGIWRLGKKKRSGFIWCILAGLLWTVKATYTYQIDLMTVEILIILTQIHAWWKWGKHENDSTTVRRRKDEPPQATACVH